jgi:hypothetical protein
MPVVVMGKLYAALRSAGVPEQLALEAAEEVLEYRRERRRSLLFPPHEHPLIPIICGMIIGAALTALPWIMVAHR